MRTQISIAKLCFFLLFIMFLACEKKSTSKNLNPVTDQEIYDVINAVVKLNRLDTINFNKQRPLRIIDSLENNRVCNPKPNKQNDGTLLYPPPLLGAVTYQHLLHSKTKCFSVNDSTFFVYQNLHPNRFVLSLSKFHLIPITNWQTYHQNIDKHIIIYSLLTLSKPIFSKNHNRAYIQCGFHCGPACGNGTEYFLIKVNGQWQVIEKNDTWIA